MTAIAASRIAPRDLLRAGAIGLRTRRLRAALSLLGVAIGIAALVSVLGISESSRADLLAQLDLLGTNLLTVAPGQSFGGDDVTLPDEAPAMIGRVGPVQAVSTISQVQGATVRRSERVDEAETGGIAVSAADTDLLTTLGGSMASGRFLDDASSRYPVVVLGAIAAERLGVGRPGVQVWIGDRRFTVAGVMAPLPLAPEIDRSALMGIPAATELSGVGEAPDVSRVYLRAHPDRIEDVRAVLPPTASPQRPEEVDVSRPSDALAARAVTDDALTRLFLGLGAVALLVGGIGIANVMVISVLERRSEIGLRRALGATEHHVGAQFLTESLILSALGGLGGLLLGSAVTAGYAFSQGWTVSIPAVALVGGLAAAVAIGAVAGLYPALRAARLAPTDALRAV